MAKHAEDIKEKGAMDGYSRKTYITNDEVAEKVNAIAYWDRKSLKDLIFEMQNNFVKAWEKKNGGPVKPVPTKK
jgi:hypothetical protein